MGFPKLLKNFKRDEDGAVTVDWVVLTAAIVGLGVAVVYTFANQSDSYASRLGTYMASQGVKTY